MSESVVQYSVRVLGELEDTPCTWTYLVCLRRMFKLALRLLFLYTQVMINRTLITYHTASQSLNTCLQGMCCVSGGTNESVFPLLKNVSIRKKVHCYAIQYTNNK